MEPSPELTGRAPLLEPNPIPDLAAAKVLSHAAWSAGDYAAIGTTLQIVGEQLAEAVDIRSGEQVLDVACGCGNTALAAARRFARVTGADFVSSLLGRAHARAATEELALDLREADAEALPFTDGSFDVVLSAFGVMFAPNQERAAAELLRVCRSGGRIALACWVPDGFVGEMLRTVSRHVPPPAGLVSPTRWGTRSGLDSLFAFYVEWSSMVEREFTFRYRSSAHFLEVFRRFYGPIHRAFATLSPTGQAALASELIELLDRRDIGGGHGLVVPGTYLEAVARRA